MKTETNTEVASNAKARPEYTVTHEQLLRYARTTADVSRELAAANAKLRLLRVLDPKLSAHIDDMLGAK